MINTYLENAVLNHLFRGQAYTAPSTLYLGVSKSAPNEEQERLKNDNIKD